MRLHKLPRGGWGEKQKKGESDKAARGGGEGVWGMHMRGLLGREGLS